MARKKVGVGQKGDLLEEGININEEVKDPDVGSHVRGVDEDMNMMSFHIDVDATEEILGNLHHLPFLRRRVHRHRQNGLSQLLLVSGSSFPPLAIGKLRA
ncbi:hypothetical protein ACMD2_18710 [Ananas comosus]|uniref:Uncharacterized protein n=1 Tax=Ananas comosus TaxID=4615 RepID=A0A199WAY2_ANACO|nr:hypothetical protein ACMD2_18710 [Ananas comosus]